jgi:hypothetical protein
MALVAAGLEDDDRKSGTCGHPKSEALERIAREIAEEEK